MGQWKVGGSRSSGTTAAARAMAAMSIGIAAVEAAAVGMALVPAHRCALKSRLVRGKSHAAMAMKRHRAEDTRLHCHGVRSALNSQGESRGHGNEEARARARC